MRGLIHAYIGEGKGKTTAAMGAAVRAAGQGRRVVIVQFLKGSETGEAIALKGIAGITLLRNARDYGFFPTQQKDIRQQVKTENDVHLREAIRLAEAGLCDFLVLDEAAAAYQLEAVDQALLDAFIRNKPEALELVLTGQAPPAHFLEAADYITEMKKVKHPFDNGIKARRGVEY